MRSGFLISLIVVLLFAGGYFYNLAQAVCPVPIKYRIGQLDERFDISLDEAKVAVAEAAEIWEEATGQNLFSYDDSAKFTVNFIYDERQEFVTEEESFSEQLESAKDINGVLSSTYESLIKEYDRLKESYDEKVEDYEERFEEYNETVREYNESGGAPPKEYAELQKERAALATRRAELESLSTNLNSLVDEINALGEKGNKLIENYNENVGEFNEKFGHAREFTQGDYNGGRINIYTYKDLHELRTVLAHELGHAMSLDHVEGDSSVMYYLIGGQPSDLELSSPDLGEFNRICGDMNLWDKIVYRLKDN